MFEAGKLGLDTFEAGKPGFESFEAGKLGSVSFEAGKLGLVSFEACKPGLVLFEGDIIGSLDSIGASEPGLDSLILKSIVFADVGLPSLGSAISKENEERLLFVLVNKCKLSSFFGLPHAMME